MKIAQNGFKEYKYQTPYTHSWKVSKLNRFINWEEERKDQRRTKKRTMQQRTKLIDSHIGNSLQRVMLQRKGSVTHETREESKNKQLI